MAYPPTYFPVYPVILSLCLRAFVLNYFFNRTVLTCLTLKALDEVKIFFH